MHEIETSIDIDAPAELVWDVLTDFAAYPEWNPRLIVTGRPTVGARLHVAPGPAAARMPSFRPRVQHVNPPRELVWLGHLWKPGIFDGEHRFRIDDHDDGSSRLVQSERFGGILAAPIFHLVRRETETGFREMNAALKDRVESLADPPSSTALLDTDG